MQVPALFSLLSNSALRRASQGVALCVRAFRQEHNLERKAYKYRSAATDTPSTTDSPARKAKNRETNPGQARENKPRMYSRTSSMTVTVPEERFAFAGLAPRSTEPEVFTFERLPPQATAVRSYVPVRPKKRCTRVMYPAKVRMHLPPPEKNQAKRWLLMLCLVVLWQIYTEEPCAEAALPAADGPVSADCRGFALQSVEEQLGGSGSGSEFLSGSPSGCEDDASSGRLLADTTCPESSHESSASRSFDQSASKSYMVALLMYHRLGGDN